MTLSAHFFTTFPQLEGIRFTHAWGGAIDTCTRFCQFWGSAYDNRVAYVVGYTGLGVAATRFGAEVMLDNSKAVRPNEPTEFVRRKPIPFPPEPLRFVGISSPVVAPAGRRQPRPAQRVVAPARPVRSRLRLLSPTS